MAEPWFTAGEQTNPATDAIVADTGQIGPGRYGFDIVIASAVAVNLMVEHRNLANDANVNAQVVYMGATDQVQFYLDVELLAGERVRIRVVTGITGKMQASIIKK